jgi:GT2 family glycosyltransferase
VFEDIGMFGSDYFMYSEDIDLCYKARARGWKAYYAPAATVIHFGGESTSKAAINTFASVMMMESRWRFFVNTRSSWYAAVYRASMMVASLLRIAGAVLLWPLAAAGGRTRRVRAALLKWTARLRWSLGGERWVKQYPGSIANDNVTAR